MTEKKAWTVLIYANGNNDLDESIFNEFRMIKDADLPENINLVVQLSRSRQKNTNNTDYEDCMGVCRYIVKNHRIYKTEDLGNISMAEPDKLLDFLVWGNDTYSSDNLVVILSGHGLGYIGLMGDSCGNNVYSMGIQGFVSALSKFHQITSKIIDILIFDTCYVNLVEVLYEIAMISGDTVKYIVIPQDNPPLEGLSWTAVINRLEADYQHIGSMDYLLRSIVESYNIIQKKEDSIFAIKLNKEYFIRLKILTDQLAGVILQKSNLVNNRFINIFTVQRDSVFISYLFLLEQIYKMLDTKELRIKELSHEIFKILDNIVLYPHIAEIGAKPDFGLKIYLPDCQEHYMQYRDFYDKLLFCFDNDWVRLFIE